MTEANKLRGKKARASGAAFEKRVRVDLEKKGWIVAKWTNNVEFDIEVKEISICSGKSKHTTAKINGKEIDAHFEMGCAKKGKLIHARNKFLGPGRPMMLGAGFPDFIAFKPGLNDKGHIYFEVIGVEAKSLGYLDKIEKEKCEWLLENNLFSKILIASKGLKRGEIIYNEFESKGPRRETTFGEDISKQNIQKTN